MISVVIVFATGGVNIYKHYCYCTGETIQSVFVKDSGCDHDGNSTACELEKSPDLNHACCVNETLPVDHSKECDDHRNCCDDEYDFFKTDQFDYAKTTKKSFKFVVAYQVELYVNEIESDHALSKTILFPEHIPPPTYGVELLKTISQLKIDFPINA